MKQKVLVIIGPTSSGKSALAVELARRFNGEVISADSRQVYKGLDIGTGKITKMEMRGVPHHLLDVASPKRIFSAHSFVVRARSAIQNISKRGKLPIVAGGTGFYVDALLGRIELPGVNANARLRSSLEKMTSEQLFALLKKRDPRRARSIDRHNKRRVVRALEIIDAMGKVPQKRSIARYKALWIGLSLPQKKLEEKIVRRLAARMQQGLIAEGRLLRKQGLSLRRMRSLGLEYRALAEYLAGEISRADLEAILARDIRRYAKKQLAYWKRNTSIQWRTAARVPPLVRRWLTAT